MIRGTVVKYKKTSEEFGSDTQVAIIINENATEGNATLVIFDEVSVLYKFNVPHDSSENQQQGTWAYF